MWQNRHRLRIYHRHGYSLWLQATRTGAKLRAKQRAVLQLALTFLTWRTLLRDSGLKQTAAAGAMADAVISAR